MTITNGYITLAEFKSALQIQAVGLDSFIEECIETASRDIDAHCGRKFWLDAAPSARTFVPYCTTHVYTTDMGATPTAVKSDTNLDGSYATTLNSADYILEPLDGIGPNGQSGWPYTAIEPFQNQFFIDANYNFGRPNTVQVTARWGWPVVPTPIKTACRRLAQLDFEARNAPFGVAGIGDLGIIRMKEDILADRHMEIFVAADAGPQVA